MAYKTPVAKVKFWFGSEKAKYLFNKKKYDIEINSDDPTFVYVYEKEKKYAEGLKGKMQKKYGKEAVKDLFIDE